MRTTFRLALSFLRERPIRLALTSLATIAATCMVVWIASGYDSLIVTFDEYANVALGRYQLAVAPISATAGQSIAPDVVAELHADPGVLAAVSKFPGVDPDRCVPIVVEQPRLLEDITGSATELQ